MVILSIETSCDETAVSIIEATGDFPNATYKVLGDAVLSQIEAHRGFGGVFPTVAKREHAFALVPILEKALSEAKLAALPHTMLYPEQKEDLRALLSREEGLADGIFSLYERYNTPAVDLIAVTEGPGLEPALWVGINFAKALGKIWKVPVIGVNHMEGHIFSSIFEETHLAPIEFPALSLLISGGHTEFVLSRNWAEYEIVGKTRDDAVGEAFDKVARMLGLPYPGGPEISKLAEEHRATHPSESINFPRPMLGNNDCDFSFSGLKTAVLYYLKGKEPGSYDRAEVARAFEDAVGDVLVGKARKAIEQFNIRTLILGGGVSANKHLRDRFTAAFGTDRSDVALYLPERKLTTDNAVMIALVAHAQYREDAPARDLVAYGNRRPSFPTNQT